MNLTVFIFVFTVSSAAVYTTEGSVCKTSSDCGSDECCYIKPAFEVVSRRRQASILPVMQTHNKTGVCEKYRVRHDQCGPLEQANGHCGCGTGMSCQFLPAEIVTAVLLTAKPVQTVSKKRGIYLPGPGVFQCELQS